MSQNISFDVIARDKASSTFSKISRSSDSTRARLAKFGKAQAAAVVGVTALTTAAVGFVKVGADYSSSLNKIQALSGITDTRLSQVSKTLEGQSGQFAKMGQTTGDAANGMVELIKAGMSVDSAMKAVNATMVLAKAGELSVADAASLVSNTLNVFHLKASRAAEVSNVLANAANISSANVSDMRQALAMAGNVAASSGASLQQTAAMLAELSNAGMQGSDAGTSLKTMLLSLQAPSSTASKGLKALGVNVFDASGKMRPIGKVLDDTTKRLAGLTDKGRAARMKQIFGSDAFRAARVIFGNGSKALADYTAKVNQAGTAQKLAQSQSKGFMGTMRQLRAEVLSSAQAAYRDLEPSLDAAAKKLSEFMQQMRTGQGAGGDFVDVLKDMVAVGREVLGFFNSIPGPVKKLGLELLIAGVAMKKLSGLTSGFAGSMVGPIARTKQFYAELSYTETRMGAVTRASRRLGAGITQAAGMGGMLLLADSAGKTGTKLGTLEAAAGGALSGAALGAFAGPAGAAVGAGIGGIAAATFSLLHHTQDAGAAAREALGKWRDYAGTLDQVTGATSAATSAMALQKLESSHVLDATRAAGLSDRQVVAATVNGGKARERVIAAMKAERTELNARVKAKQAEVSADLKTSTSFFNTTAQQRQAASDRAIQSKRELDGLKDLRSARGKDIDAVLHSLGVVSAATEKTRSAYAATRQFSKGIKELPARKRTYVETVGLKAGVSGVVELARQIHLTPKDIKVLLRENGAAATDAQVKLVQDRARALGAMKPVVHVGADTSGASAKIQALILSIARIKDKTVHIRASTNANVAEAVSGGRTMDSAGRMAGRSYIDGLLKGIANRRLKVSKAIDLLGARMSAITDRLSGLRSTRQDFLSTFSSDSIFGADLETTGKSLGGLMAFQQGQAQKAAQLAADVQRAASMGLSKSLISQLQQAGASGAEQLHLLAGGSVDQIRQFNALDAQTQASLQAAGMTAGNAGRGGNIDSDIAVAKRQETLLTSVLAELRHIRDQELTVVIDSEGVVKLIKRRMHKKGVRTSDQLVRALT